MASPRPWSRYRRLLGSRDFTAFWTAQATSLLGDAFSYLALAWLVLQLTGSPAALGAVLAVQGIPRAALMLVGGAVSDHLSPRLTMVLSALGRALVAAALAALVLAHAATLWHVLVAAFLLGAVSAFFLPARSAILPQLVESNLLEAGNAALQVSQWGANVAGPALAGLTVAAYGPGAAIAVDAACFTVAAAALLLVRGGASAASGAPRIGRLLANIRDGVAYVWRSVPLRSLMGATLVLNLAFSGPYTVGITVLARERLGGPSALGWALGGLGAGAVLGALAMGTLPWRPRPGRLMITSALWLGAGLVLVGLLPNLALVVACTFLMGLGAGAGNTVGAAWTQRFTEPAMLGRVISLVMLASFGLGPLSYAISGVLAQTSLVLLFALGGGLMLLTGGALASSRTFRSLG